MPPESVECAVSADAPGPTAFLRLPGKHVSLNPPSSFAFPRIDHRLRMRSRVSRRWDAFAIAVRAPAASAAMDCREMSQNVALEKKFSATAGAPTSHLRRSYLRRCRCRNPPGHVALNSAPPGCCCKNRLELRGWELLGQAIESCSPAELRAGSKLLTTYRSLPIMILLLHRTWLVTLQWPRNRSLFSISVRNSPN